MHFTQNQIKIELTYIGYILSSSKFTDLICNILSEFQQDSSKMLEIDNKFKILDQLLNTAKTYGASVDFIASIFTVFTMFTRNSDYNLSLDYYF